MGFRYLGNFFVITEILFVSQDWKKIKAMLNDPENTNEGALCFLIFLKIYDIIYL